MNTKDERIEDEMRELAQKVVRAEERFEENGELNEESGRINKPKLPLFHTRMSPEQGHKSQEAFTSILSEIDKEIKLEGLAINDGRGRRSSGRSLIMSCAVDLIIASHEPVTGDSSDFQKELAPWKDFLVKYIKERRKAKDCKIK